MTFEDSTVSTASTVDNVNTALTVKDDLREFVEKNKMPLIAGGAVLVLGIGAFLMRKSFGGKKEETNDDTPTDEKLDPETTETTSTE